MIGALKHIAEVKQIIKQDNGRGGWTEIEQERGFTYVGKYNVTKQLQTQFRQAGMAADTKFLARYNEDINPNTRLVVNRQKYKVESVDLPADPRDFMEIYCVRVGGE